MLNEPKAAPVGERDSVTVLPDGSAFGVMSFQLPRDHWLYAEREYDDGADQPKELPSPILTHELRSAVEAAVRYAVRGATDCGRESDFDPDALVQNAIYALCGPFGAAPSAPATVQGDADNYRWLREQHNDVNSDIGVYDGANILATPEGNLDLDAAIAAARKGEQ